MGKPFIKGRCIYYSVINWEVGHSMGKPFIKGRCPVCGWQLSPKQWYWARGDNRTLGLLFQSFGKCLMSSNPLRSPEGLEQYQPGLFGVIKSKLLDAVARWVRYRWVPMCEVLNALPLKYLGGGMWVEEFERPGRQAVERSIGDYEVLSGERKVVSTRKIKPVIGREVKTYDW